MRLRKWKPEDISETSKSNVDLKLSVRRMESGMTGRLSGLSAPLDMTELQKTGENFSKISKP